MFCCLRHVLEALILEEITRVSSRLPTSYIVSTYLGHSKGPTHDPYDFHDILKCCQCKRPRTSPFLHEKPGSRWTMKVVGALHNPNNITKKMSDCNQFNKSHAIIKT